MALGQQHKEMGKAGEWEQRESEGQRQRVARVGGGVLGPSLTAYWSLGAGWISGIVKLQKILMEARIVKAWQAVVQSLNLTLLRY